MTNSFLIFVPMNDELKDTKDFLQEMSDRIHFFVSDMLPERWILLVQIMFKFAFLTALVYLVDFVLKFLLNSIFRAFFNKDQYPGLKSVYQSRITNSLSHLIALLFGSFALLSVCYRHPKSFTFLERMVGLAPVSYTHLDVYKRQR